MSLFHNSFSRTEPLNLISNRLDLPYVKIKGQYEVNTKIYYFITIFFLTFNAIANELDDGISAYKEKRYTEALPLLKKAAGQGHVEAQYNLGNMYAFGQGVPKDIKQAMSWTRKAAKQGDVKGQYNLGTMYDNGHGVPKDMTKANKWIKAAYDGSDTSISAKAKTIWDEHQLWKY